MEVIIKTFQGLEETLQKEIQNLGVTETRISRRAVLCEASWQQIYTLNYQLRTATRVLIPIQRFQAEHPDDLYQRVLNINWSDYLDPQMVFRIDANVKSNVFTHSKYAALKVKDAIADYFRTREGIRPSVSIDNPDLRINLHINEINCTISLDSSGDSLHKRGYYLKKLEAPLNEALAAGIVLLSGWDKEKPFVDPMCGSGTIPIEAALYACNIPPHADTRIFGFMKWKNYNARLWNKVKDNAKSNIVEQNIKIYASDKDRRAVQISKDNVAEAGLNHLIEVKHHDFVSDGPLAENVCIIMNPPYDERIELANDLRFYKAIGDTLKQSYKNSEAWIFSANIDAIKHIGLKTSARIHLFNGALPAKLHKYEMYDGSKKVQ